MIFITQMAMKQFNSLFSRSQFVLLFFLSLAFLLLMISSAFVLLWFPARAATPLTVIAPLIGYLLVGNLLIFAIIMLLILRRVNQLFAARLSVEEALQISEQRHRALLETIPDIVLRRKRNGVYTDFKPARHFGRFIRPADFLGKNMSEFLPPEVVEVSMAASERALASGVEQIYQYRMPQRLTGALRDYEGRVVPVNEDEVQVIIRDITEEKLQAARTQQAQKLESLGLLAGGVAHDFNNLLTGIMAQLSLARFKFARNLPLLDQLDKAMVAAERAADLTRQLLAYAGKGNFQLTLLDVSGLVRDTAGLFSAALPNRAELQLDLADALPAVTVDRNRLQQVVMNLVLNAAEALGNTGGYVRICTGMQLLVTSHEVSHYVGEALAPGAYVTLQVSDNGCGMEQTMLQQIFDPFFSTKSTGHGLGLAATLGIMRTHHGGIVVESQLGVGSTFTLLLPATTAQVPTPQSVAATTTHHYCSPPTLLVIDDEVAIREAVTDLLTTAGITILTAASGQEGIDLFRRQGDQIDLILLDMKMPQLSGEETLRALCQIDPTVNVILSSGYTETEIHHLQQEANVVAFLPKPYNFAQLTAAIHDALHHLASVAPVEAAE